MRFKFALVGAVVVALGACGTADIYNGGGALQSASSTTTGGSTGAPTNGSTTGTETTGTAGAGTTGTPVMGTTTSTTGGSTTTATTGTTTGGTTTGGMTTGGTTTTTTTGGMGGNPNSGDPNNPNTMNPNTLPTNAFFNTMDLGTGQNVFVLVLSTSPDYCTKITGNKLPASTDNVRVEVQSFNQIEPGSYAAIQATDDQLDSKCNDSQSNVMPASIALSSINSNSATGTVMVTEQGQSLQGTFNAALCDAITSQNNLVTVIVQGLANGHCD